MLENREREERLIVYTAPFNNVGQYITCPLNQPSIEYSLRSKVQDNHNYLSSTYVRNPSPHRQVYAKLETRTCVKKKTTLSIILRNRANKKTHTNHTHTQAKIILNSINHYLRAAFLFFVITIGLSPDHHRSRLTFDVWNFL